MMPSSIATLVLALVALQAVKANHTLVGYFIEYEHKMIQLENDLNRCKTKQEGT